MVLKDAPIQRKLMMVILITSGAVLLLTCTAFFAYEFFTFRQTTVQQLSTLGKIVATNSTAALAFENEKEGDEILTALKAERHIVAASLYNEEGKLFSRYPSNQPISTFPAAPEPDGYRFDEFSLVEFQPVIQGNKRLGTLYLKSDLEAINKRFRLYSIITFCVIVVSFFLAYLLSKNLQRRISKPIQALAQTAKAISERHDYSVRALKSENDELGMLTDAFNHMLIQIEAQNLMMRESNERLESIVESMGDAYVSLDKQFRYTFINNKALSLLTIPKLSLLGQVLWDAFPDTVGTIFETEYRKVMETRLPSSFETYYATYDMWIEVRTYPYEEGIAIFYSNITKYKKAEEDIKSFNQMLEQKVSERTLEMDIANKELEAFSYSISHDLRAPLRSIHGYMNILSEEYISKLDDEANRLVNIVINSAERMGQLIDDLLTFSRLGRKELVKTSVSMKDMVMNIWEEQIRAESNRDIEFELFELPESLVDIGTIRQVWTNLISNAIKYTRLKDKTRIEINFEINDKDVTYFVRDNGSGFDMKYYDKLFGVFQRLHSQLEFDGTGVGLAIVERIITKHGGKIWAEAEPNVGATFYFSIPT